MTEERNPYAAPKVAVLSAAEPAPVAAGELVLLAEPRRCRAGEGADWVAQGWELFRRRWDVLLVMIILLWLLNALVGLVPFVGNLVMALFGPVLNAGLMLALRQVETGGKPTVGILFAGFSSPRLGQLILLGLASLLGMLLLFAAVGVPAVAMFGMGILGGEAPDPASLGIGLFLLLVIFAVLLFAWIALIYFALPLVLFHEVNTGDALRMSLTATLRNWASLTLYGLMAIGLAIATVFTLFIGMLVVAPLLMAAYYRSYRAIFTQP